VLVLAAVNAVDAIRVREHAWKHSITVSGPLRQSSVRNRIDDHRSIIHRGDVDQHALRLVLPPTPCCLPFAVTTSVFVPL
jgi:hypothetical protein